MGLGRRRGLGAAPTRGLRPRGRMARGPSAGLLDGGGSPGVEVEARGGELGRGSRRRPRPAEVQASRQGDGRATGVGRQGGCAGSGGTGQGGSRRRRRTKGSGRSSRRERWRRCEEEEGRDEGAAGGKRRSGRPHGPARSGLEEGRPSRAAGDVGLRCSCAGLPTAAFLFFSSNRK